MAWFGPFETTTEKELTTSILLALFWLNSLYGVHSKFKSTLNQPMTKCFVSPVN